jgi:hypothetical protein
MASTKAKYIGVWSKDIQLLAAKMSALAADGYTLIETMFQPTYAFPDGSTGGFDFYAFMKLKEDVSLKDVTELINVDISRDGGEIRKLVSEGWEIVAAFSKNVTMVKRRPAERVLISPELRAQREAAAQ